MVNANVIISVSAVLVALLLTIVIVMRADGDPNDNFSINVQGTGYRDGVAYNADMYYCTGEDCVFYKYVDTTPVDYIFSVGDSFPGYFALVGFEDSDSGDTYVTEHSIGYTFVYNGGSLTKCIKSEELDATAVAESADSMAASFKAGEKDIYDEDGNKVYTINDYSLDTDVTDDVPTVNGHGVPSVYECQVLWSAEASAACTAARGEDCGGDAIFNPADIEKVYDISSLESEDNDSVESGRRLISGSSSFNSGDDWTVTPDTFAHLASWVYKNPNSPRLPGGWNEYATCEKVWKVPVFGSEYGRSTARIAYSQPSGKRGKLVVAFAGSNDAADWMYNADIRNQGTYHRGFHDYVMDVRTCLDGHIKGSLSSHGVDYVIGHSLGGAAASTYRHMGASYLSNAKVVSWGAPKNKRAPSACSLPGTRFFHQSDPVPSNFGWREPIFGISIGALRSYNHDVATSARCSNTNTSCKTWDYSWGWKGKYKDGCKIWNQNNYISGAGCADMSDVTPDISKHMMTSYRTYDLNSIAI